MGSKSFVTYSYGKTVDSAYTSAVEDADERYGHQEGYSGEINCSGGFKDITKEFKASGKSLDQFVKDQIEKLSKYDGARAVCIQEPVENPNKIKTQVDHIVEKGTKKWVLRYSVYEGWSNHFVAAFDKKGEAVARARKHTEEHKAETYVKMEKKLESGSAITAKIIYKKSDKERPGKWVFFGWASY